MTAPSTLPARPLAAIDIGTNTIRLLVAQPVADGDALGLRPLADRTATVRLGMGVERTGRLDPERLARAVAAVEEFWRVALAQGADPILLAATSAVRDAANGAELRERIAAATGLPLPVIDGDREAVLTFAGATAGQSPAGTTLVGDLGGGSFELIVARDGVPLSARSLQLGSGRLAERHLHADPPDRWMVAAAEADARATLAPVAAGSPPLDRGILVGGTATSLLVLTPRAPDGPALTARRLEDALALLTASPAAALARESGLDPERVRTLPAGAAICRAALAAYGLERAIVGRGGIREGLILEHLRG